MPKVQRELKRAFNAFIKAEADNRQGEAAGEHVNKLKSILYPHYTRAWEQFGGRMLQDGQKSSEWETPAFDAARQAWIQGIGVMKVTEIVGTTQAQARDFIRKATQQAINEGLGEQGAAKLIRQGASEQGAMLSQYRSRVIARTETHGSATASTQEAASIGKMRTKTWLHTSARSRDAHIKASGQTVPINQPFEVDGERLEYPGDPSGSAENVINCMCVALYER